MHHWTRSAPLRYRISDFFSSLLDARQRIASQSQTKNDMNGILSWPETRPYAFDPWCDVFCESLAEFLRECVLVLLFLAFSFSGSPVRTGRNPCLRFQESTDLAMPWSTNQGSQRCARRPTRRLPSPRDYAD